MGQSIILKHDFVQDNNIINDEYQVSNIVDTTCGSRQRPPHTIIQHQDAPLTTATVPQQPLDAIQNKSKYKYKSLTRMEHGLSNWGNRHLPTHRIVVESRPNT